MSVEAAGDPQGEHQRREQKATISCHTSDLTSTP